MVRLCYLLLLVTTTLSHPKPPQTFEELPQSSPKASILNTTANTVIRVDVEGTSVVDLVDLELKQLDLTNLSTLLYDTQLDVIQHIWDGGQKGVIPLPYTKEVVGSGLVFHTFSKRGHEMTWLTLSHGIVGLRTLMVEMQMSREAIFFILDEGVEVGTGCIGLYSCVYGGVSGEREPQVA